MLKKNLTVKVTLLSDLHIGSGTGLQRNLDWLLRNDTVYVANPLQIGETILDRALKDGKSDESVINAITGLTLNDLADGGWLTAEDFQPPNAIFRYRMRGEPATKEIREQIKSVEGQPYLPGSSLKGAIRTVLAVAAAAEMKPNLAVNQLGRNRYWAAQPVEQQLFGRDPNHDLLRLIQVSDSQPIDAKQLRLRRVHIYPTASNNERGRSRGLDLDLETVAKGSEFISTIHMPLELLQKGKGDFEQRRAQELSGWDTAKKWIDRMAFHGKQYGSQLIIEEIDFFIKRTDVPAVHAFYNQLADRFSQMNKSQFMLPLGWGTGWHTKTLSQALRADRKNFEAIVSQHRLDPTGTRKAGDRFPKSRHLTRQPDGRPGEPLGWVLVELQAAEN